MKKILLLLIIVSSCLLAMKQPGVLSPDEGVHSVNKTSARQVSASVEILGAACGVNRQLGNWIASTTNDGTGRCTVIWQANYFSEIPFCQVTPSTISSRFCPVNCVLANCEVRCYQDTGSLVSENFILKCSGLAGSAFDSF